MSLGSYYRVPYRMGVLSRTLFSHSPGGRELEIKVWAGLVSPEAPSLACKYGSFLLLSSHGCLRVSVSWSSYPCTCQIRLGPPQWPHFALVMVAPNTVTFWGPRGKDFHIWVWGNTTLGKLMFEPELCSGPSVMDTLDLCYQIWEPQASCLVWLRNLKKFN